MSDDTKKEKGLTRLLSKVSKMDGTCEEIRAKISKLRETLGEPDEICPDEVESEKVLKGFLEEMILVNIAENTKDKGEA